MSEQRIGTRCYLKHVPFSLVPVKVAASVICLRQSVNEAVYCTKCSIMSANGSQLNLFAPKGVVCRDWTVNQS